MDPITPSTLQQRRYSLTRTALYSCRDGRRGENRRPVATIRWKEPCQSNTPARDRQGPMDFPPHPCRFMSEDFKSHLADGRVHQ